MSGNGPQHGQEVNKGNSGFYTSFMRCTKRTATQAAGESACLQSETTLLAGGLDVSGGRLGHERLLSGRQRKGTPPCTSLQAMGPQTTSPPLSAQAQTSTRATRMGGAPPEKRHSASSVGNLSRYTHRVAISNSRLIAAETFVPQSAGKWGLLAGWRIAGNARPRSHRIAKPNGDDGKTMDGDWASVKGCRKRAMFFRFSAPAGFPPDLSLQNVSAPSDLALRQRLTP